MNTHSIASQNHSSVVHEPSFGVQDVSNLPDITQYLTPYLLRTLEMLHNVHGASPVIQNICLSLSYHHTHSTACLSHTRPTTNLEDYQMKQYIDTNPLPSHLPFIADHCATIIPSTCAKQNNGVMADIVEAMRRTTTLIINQQGHFVFSPPTTQDIQNYLSSAMPEKFPPTKGVASGWRNTVNQCLTHGQGWNFLTFPPTDGTKNKRHLLFERAFNGSYIIGSGQCKGLNDLKPKNNNRNSSRRVGAAKPTYTQYQTPPTTPESFPSSQYITSPEWSLDYSSLLSCGGGSTQCLDSSAGLAAIETGLVASMQSPPVESGRSLAEVEADLIRMLCR
jgi:hypothetical protein